MIDGAGLLHFVGDERIALVEKQYPELLAAACTIFNSVMPAPPSPFTSASSASGAAMTSAKEPNFANRVLASGLTSRRGSARNNNNSNSS
jgi:hypothetical protein